jgi:hypothetical protein
MAWRYRRRLRIIPAITLNFGKTGATSVSKGFRAHLTLGRYSRRATAYIRRLNRHSPDSGLL